MRMYQEIKIRKKSGIIYLSSSKPSKTGTITPTLQSASKKTNLKRNKTAKIKEKNIKKLPATVPSHRSAPVTKPPQAKVLKPAIHKKKEENLAVSKAVRKAVSKAEPKKRKSSLKTRNGQKRLVALSKMFATAAAVIALITYGPSLYYTSLQVLGINITSNFRDDAVFNISAVGDEFTLTPSVYRPKFDASLPQENRVIIRSAGIDTTIWEVSGEDTEAALRKGVLREPDYGYPENRELPTVLSAHRYGYLAWSVPYRLKNSFFNLPKLKVGDTVEVIWKQRKYVYAVYAEETSIQPSIAGADLILYTCKDLNSDISIFKYAKLLEI